MSSLFSSGDYNGYDGDGGGWWRWWFWRPRVKFLCMPKTGDGKTSEKFPESSCRINKTHTRNLFNGRVHIIIMCKHPTWLSPRSSAPAWYTTETILLCTQNTRRISILHNYILTVHVYKVFIYTSGERARYIDLWIIQRELNYSKRPTDVERTEKRLYLHIGAELMHFNLFTAH